MDISALNRSVQSLPVSTPAVSDERATENRDVVQAVKALNRAEMYGSENELLFQRDQESQRMVIRLVDRKTKEVVTQIPAEYVLRAAEELKRLAL